MLTAIGCRSLMVTSIPNRTDLDINLTHAAGCATVHVYYGPNQCLRTSAPL